MEAIRISCAGYPTRKNFDEFARRFSILEPKVLKTWYFHTFLLTFSPFLVIYMKVIVEYVKLINDNHVFTALMR